MVLYVKPGFCRRPSLEGRTISFCTQCFAVVAEAKDCEQLLQDGERDHTCDPWMLEHWETVSKDAQKKCA